MQYSQTWPRKGVFCSRARELSRANDGQALAAVLKALLAIRALGAAADSAVQGKLGRFGLAGFVWWCASAASMRTYSDRELQSWSQQPTPTITLQVEWLPKFNCPLSPLLPRLQKPPHLQLH